MQDSLSGPSTAGDAVFRLPLFSDLTPELANRLLARAQMVRRRKDAILFAEGAPADQVFILMRGSVELTKLDGGSDCGVMLLSRGDIFSLGAAISDEPHLTSARALSPVILLSMPAEALREEASRSPAIALRLLITLSGQWRTATRHIIDLKCRTAAQRVGAFFLRLVDNRGESADRAELLVPKSRVAARLGISPETLSRSLHTLAEKGLVVRGPQIRVTDRAAVEHFCALTELDGGEAHLGVRAL
ncbi:putative CRP/FNR family transcriptional regulator [Sphingomonas changbaiensis NBRC 104936]|uniref:Putative CRP/FNR family transcriptional regulator n=1 Tax=Sphingomonas changbaiensis NBRC 104936 TaxID=1219043 RepID=A0A0E9MMZ4_9SPHN|nr:putative CRP/FNR family transcriptional regulator [Sphingomonas changbaiensis NBRC 104936]